MKFVIAARGEDGGSGSALEGFVEVDRGRGCALRGARTRVSDCCEICFASAVVAVMVVVMVVEDK